MFPNIIIRMWRHPVKVLHRSLQNFNRREAGEIIGVIVPQCAKPVKAKVGQSIGIFNVKNNPNEYNMSIGFKNYGKVIDNVLITDVKFNETNKTTHHLTTLKFNKPDTYDMIMVCNANEYSIEIVIE